METSEYWIRRREAERKDFFEGVTQQEAIIAGKRGRSRFSTMMHAR